MIEKKAENIDLVMVIWRFVWLMLEDVMSKRREINLLNEPQM